MSKSLMKNKKLSLFFFTMISSSLVVSIRNLPTIAETQMKMLFFGGVATLFYFIPAALTSAELATGWPKIGGIYVWAKEAFGKKLGFFAIWLQWTYMIISVIAMVYFIGGSIAYVVSGELAENRTFLIGVALFIIWVFTILNLKGLHTTSLISTIGFLSGVVFPGLLIIILGIVYVFMGHPIQIDATLTVQNYFPNFSDLATFVLLVGFMRAFAGIEVSSSHANDVKNPQRNIPIALFIVVLIGLVVNIIGSLSVAVVVPQKDISLIAGIMEAFKLFFSQFHMKWLVPILAILVAVGQTGGVSTWIMGPVKGLLATAKEGDLPVFFAKVNKNNAPKHLLIMQAIIMSIISSALLLFPSINIAFWFSVALSMLIYGTMYTMMFLSGIILRYTQPRKKRAYRIPGKKNIGMWIATFFGVLIMLFAYIIAFIPPAEIPLGNRSVYVSCLVIGILLVYALPFIITKKKSFVKKGKNNQRK